MKKHNNIYIPFLLLIVFTELILGGLGRLFYFPLRISLFILIFLFTLLDILKNRKIYITKKLFIGIVIVGLILAFFTGYSVFLGNSITRTLNYLQVYLSILYIPIIQQLIRNKKECMDYLIELFIKYIFGLSIVTIIMVVFSYFSKYLGIDALGFMLNIKRITNYGIITGWLYNNLIVRVYFANGIFMQVAVAILGMKIINNEQSKNDNIKLVTIIIAILASNTRGYWLGLIIVYMLLLTINKRKVKFIITGIIIICISSLVLNKIGVLDDVVNRINSSINFNSDVSNIQRKYQMDIIGAGIKKRPILGHGIGSEIQGYYEATGRDSDDVELYYHELVYKVGYLGLAIFLFVILRAIIKSIILTRKKIYKIHKVYIMGYAIGLLSVLITSATNPYLRGANGFFSIIMFFCMYNIYFSKSRESKYD